MSDNGNWHTFTNNKKKRKSHDEKKSHAKAMLKPNDKPSFALKLIQQMIKNNSPSIRSVDLRNLLITVLDGGQALDWIVLKNAALIDKAVVIAVNSLNYYLVDKYSIHLPNLSKFFQKIPLQADGTLTRIQSSIHSMLTVVDSSVKRNVKKQRVTTHPFLTSFDLNIVPNKPAQFLMSSSQLAQNNYPFDNESPQYVSTENFLGVDDQGNILHELVAMDCEMCITKNGLELTRISIVNHKLETIFDEFVVPKDPIIDYNTRFSGITKEILDGVETTLEDIQIKLKTIISKDTIIVGHSLENDLKALRIIHKNVIDTSIIYPRGDSSKHALRFLTKNFLKENIQEFTHDSVQDSIATMKLLHLKLINDISFGRDDTDKMIIFEMLHRRGKKSCVAERSEAMIRRFASASTSSSLCASDEEVIQKVIGYSQDNKSTLTWGQLRDLTTFLSAHPARFTTTPKDATKQLATFANTIKDASSRLGENEDEDLGESVVSNPDEIEAELIAKLEAIDRQIGLVYERLPANAMFLVTSVHEGMTKADFNKILIKSGYKGEDSKEEQEDETEELELSSEEEDMFRNSLATKRSSVCFLALKS